MTGMDKKIGEVFEIILDNRGSSGLTMKYTLDRNDIVSIEGPKFLKPENIMPGDSIKVSFKIRTLKAGSVKVLFFETQVWDKNFQPHQVLELTINVVL